MLPSDRKLLRRIFREASTTFYWTSRLFPHAIRDDVEALYAFVRIADDCVDTLPQDARRLDDLQEAFRGSDAVHLTDDDAVVVRAFQVVATRHAFDPTWIDVFFHSMRMDLARDTYSTMDDLLVYIYGSAEVIGLMMGRIMGVSPDILPTAGMLGRAFQYINMLRDIGVDQQLGRTYIPGALLAQYELPDLTETTARQYPDRFVALMSAELARYRAWQLAGMTGISALPRLCRPAVRAACAAFARTAEVIEADPLSVYTRAYKPSRIWLAARLLRSSLPL